MDPQGLYKCPSSAPDASSGCVCPPYSVVIIPSEHATAGLDLLAGLGTHILIADPLKLSWRSDGGDASPPPPPVNF